MSPVRVPIDKQDSVIAMPEDTMKGLPDSTDSTACVSCRAWTKVGEQLTMHAQLTMQCQWHAHMLELVHEACSVAELIEQ
jgi:hypothetical protein